MGNQKLREMLALGTVLLFFFITECQGSGNALGGEKDSFAGLSIGEKRKADDVDSSRDALVDQPASENKKQKKEDRASNRASGVICPQQEIEITMEDAEQLDENDGQALASGSNEAEDKKKTLEIKNLDLRLWNDRRLENKRRKAYKLSYKSIYTCDTSNTMSKAIGRKYFREKLRNDIEVYSTHIFPSVEQNPLWYFIASETTNMKSKYKDLLGLKRLFVGKEDAKYTEILENLKGYYPGVFDDMLAYMQKHLAMKVRKEKNLAAWEETLGDIYIRKDIEPNLYILKKQEEIAQMDEKYHEVAHALHMILILPEVYQDFCTMHENHISKVRMSTDPYANKKKKNILLLLCEMAKKIENSDEGTEGICIKLYNTFADIYNEEKMAELTAADLYRDMYVLIGKFYEEADVFGEKNKYVLEGKCIITNQKYMKCQVKADISAEERNRRVQSSEYTPEENKWGISSDVHAHYHVYYVDNGTNQLRLLCMPVYADAEGQEHYLHTINDVVKHIKMLYGIKKKFDVIHPFIVKTESREWSYIEEKERNKTIKDLKDLEECEVVFYRIEEDLERAKFTFAEFLPFKHEKKSSICIPLFLTPFMRSAVELGPFKKKKEHSEINPVKIKDTAPDLYEYNSKYKDLSYSDVHKYYRNLYILSGKEKLRTLGCYIMDCKTTKHPDGAVEAVWYVRMPSSVNSYTHCMLDRTFREEENIKKFNAFVKTVESREYNKDSEMQAFWLQNSQISEDPLENQTKKIHAWLLNRQDKKNAPKKSLERLIFEINERKEKLQEIEQHQKSLGAMKKYLDTYETAREKKTAASLKYTRKKKIKDLCQELYTKLSKKPKHLETDFIILRNVNHSKSNLCAHNEILDTLVTRYNKKISE
ncbi:hypothetical protein NEMIN01_1748 [Nematocida minor]|uniref:uncharacterized protein n=1 Tax=Nematocida minor TaxID=1912983 RepID=UPI00221EF05B|nr:uncharacterized protein NEMIN01_1748 [Nematocida minor]KAI5191930.1 hypothetical protein NEMIN01_1748 [Nematocida minor]